MTQRPSVDYNVYLDTVITPSFKVISIAESAGADRLDVATLELDGVGLDDLTVANYLNKEIEIERAQTEEIVHWGKTTMVPTALNRNGETVQVVSRTEHYHLGERVNGYWVWDPVAAAPALVDGELVFNPLIDGAIFGNLNNTLSTNGASPGNPLFLDPESVRTVAARTLQGADIEHWSLAGAVYYLLWSLNTSETYISNLSLATLLTIFDDAAAVVRDVLVPRGTYLGQALDLLLNPLGYLWKVKRTSIGAREFSFWKRGTGGSLVTTVSHQRVGATLDTDLTNVETSGVTFDAASLANEVTVLGGLVEYEITAELVRAWATADDPPAGIGDELAKDHQDFDDVRNVMRKWVLNEAGDYIGLRTEINGLFPAALRSALSSAGILNRFVARRRKLLPTLTLDTDGTPIGKTAGVEVEYSNASGSPEWHAIGPWACSLLEREAGLYFDGDRLPDEFLVDPANLRIRVTFTLQGDVRLAGFAERQAGSPNEDVVPLVASAPDRFRYRLRESSLSKYNGSGLPSLAANDTTAIADFATYAREAWDIMKIGGAIQLEGIDFEYSVGDRVEKIALKNMSFEAKASSGMYPQIVAIERNVTTQTMVLHLEQFRDPLALPPPTRGSRSRFSPRNTGRRALR